MFTSDIQILKLPKILKKDGKISSSLQFHEETGVSKSYFSNVKNQEKYGRSYHFTPAQIEKICLIYGIDFNWVFANSEDVYSKNKSPKKAQIN